MKRNGWIWVWQTITFCFVTIHFNTNPCDGFVVHVEDSSRYSNLSTVNKNLGGGGGDKWGWIIPKDEDDSGHGNLKGLSNSKLEFSSDSKWQDLRDNPEVGVIRQKRASGAKGVKPSNSKNSKSGQGQRSRSLSPSPSTSRSSSQSSSSPSNRPSSGSSAASAGQSRSRSLSPGSKPISGSASRGADGRGNKGEQPQSKPSPPKPSGKETSNGQNSGSRQSRPRPRAPTQTQTQTQTQAQAQPRPRPRPKASPRSDQNSNSLSEGSQSPSSDSSISSSSLPSAPSVRIPNGPNSNNPKATGPTGPCKTRVKRTNQRTFSNKCVRTPEGDREEKTAKEPKLDDTEKNKNVNNKENYKENKIPLPPRIVVKGPEFTFTHGGEQSYAYNILTVDNIPLETKILTKKEAKTLEMSLGAHPPAEALRDYQKANPKVYYGGGKLCCTHQRNAKLGGQSDGDNLLPGTQSFNIKTMHKFENPTRQIFKDVRTQLKGTPAVGVLQLTTKLKVEDVPPDAQGNPRPPKVPVVAFGISYFPGTATKEEQNIVAAVMKNVLLKPHKKTGKVNYIETSDGGYEIQLTNEKKSKVLHRGHPGYMESSPAIPATGSDSGSKDITPLQPSSSNSKPRPRPRPRPGQAEE